MWFYILNIASTINLSNEDDEMIWELHSSGLYSVQSLYTLINFRGVSPVHVPAVWELYVPPRVHFFLWLVAHNKVLTRDNLSKRQFVPDTICLFCEEQESVMHLFFFHCNVAKLLWERIINIGNMWLHRVGTS